MPDKKPNRNPINEWAEISKMRKTEGWKILMEMYAKEGDSVLSMILDPEIDKDKREMCVYELRALGRLSAVLQEFEDNAKRKDKSQSEPKHIGN